MLDIGCGTLRGGRHFIGYLDAGRYTGMEISKQVLAYGEKLLVERGLVEKQPRGKILALNLAPPRMEGLYPPRRSRSRANNHCR